MHLRRLAPLWLPSLVLLSVAPRLQAQTPEPCDAYVDSFQRGLDAFNAGARDVARAAWREALPVSGCGPDVAYNLAVLAVMADDLAGAEALYTTALARLDAWPDSVQALPEGLQMRAGLYTGLLNVGARHFVAERFAEALGAFTDITARDSLHRDAWYNEALALYKLARWRDLAPIAERVVALDPLNYNAHVLRFNAYRELGEAARTRGDARTVRRYRRLAEGARAASEALPIRLENVQVASEGGAQTLRVQVAPGRLTPGTPVRLAVTLLGVTGPLVTQEVTVTAPRTPELLLVRFPDAPGATTVRYRVLAR